MSCGYNRFLGNVSCGDCSGKDTVLNNCEVTIGNFNIANVQQQSVVNNNGSQWHENESAIFYNNENKSVLVGTDTPTGDYKMEVSGLLKVQEVICVSDERLKEKVERIDRPSERLEGIRGVGFEWKDGDGKRTHGVLAQDVERALPGATVTDPETGSMAVNYNALTGLLIEAVKSQAREIRRLGELCARSSSAPPGDNAQP